MTCSSSHESELERALEKLFQYGKNKGGEDLFLFRVPEDWQVDADVFAVDTKLGYVWALVVMPGPESGVSLQKNGSWVHLQSGRHYADPLERARRVKEPLQEKLRGFLTAGKNNIPTAIPVGACPVFPLTQSLVFRGKDRQETFIEYSLFSEDFEDADPGELPDVLKSMCDVDMLDGLPLKPRQIKDLMTGLQALPAWNVARARAERARKKAKRKQGRKSEKPLRKEQTQQHKKREADISFGREVLKALKIWALVPTIENEQLTVVYFDKGEGEVGESMKLFKSTFLKSVRGKQISYVLFPGNEQQARVLNGLLGEGESRNIHPLNAWTFRVLANDLEEDWPSWPWDIYPETGKRALDDLVEAFGRSVRRLTSLQGAGFHAVVREGNSALVKVLRKMTEAKLPQNRISGARGAWREDLCALTNISPGKVPLKDTLYVVPEAWLDLFAPEPRRCAEPGGLPLPGEFPEGVSKEDQELIRAVWGQTASEYEPDELRGKMVFLPDHVVVVSYRACLDPVVRKKLSDNKFAHCVAVAPEIAGSEMEVRCQLPSWTYFGRNIVIGPGKWYSEISRELVEERYPELEFPDIPDEWPMWLERPYRKSDWELVFRPEYADESLVELLGLSSMPRVWRLKKQPATLPLTMVAPRYGTKMLQSSSPYRETYLASVAVRTAGLSKQRRVLLLMRNEAEAATLESTMKKVDSGPWEIASAGNLFDGNNRGKLVISTESTIPQWILLTLKGKSTEKLFDLVLLEAFPSGLCPASPASADDDQAIDPLASEEGEEFTTGGTISGDSRNRRVRSGGEAEADLSRLKILTGIGFMLSKDGLYVLDQRIESSHMRSMAPDLAVRSLRRPPRLQDPHEWRRKLVETFDTVKPGHMELQFPPQVAWDRLASSMVGKNIKLHDWQKSFIEKIVRNEQDPLAIERETGGGKSLVFQFPAMLRSLSSGRLTIVVSPLKALMHEQAGKFMEWGFGSVVQALSGDVTRQGIFEAYQKIRGGELLMIFVAPERFRSASFRDTIEERLSKDKGAAFWVFDEAHCISLWGQEFRPDYLYCAKEIVRLREGLTSPGKILLVSATLPDHVIKHLEREVFVDEH